MQRGFGGTAFEPMEKPRRDRELTLGPTMLALLGLGLFTLCGVCFVFGYAMGQRVSPSTPASGSSTAYVATPPAQAGSVGTKPAPSQSGFQPRPASELPATNAAENAKTATPNIGQTAQSVAVPVQPLQNSVTLTPPPDTERPSASVVQAALPRQSGGAQRAVVTGTLVKPALSQGAGQAEGLQAGNSQAGSWMVQIAAVSHPEDAQVLVSALRKRGYAVSVHRDPIDALMHVEVGPFATHSDASTMRQKLLNDGYNAMIQP